MRICEMAMTVAIFPGTLIILLCLQNILAQQYLNNAGSRNSAGGPQQPLLKTTCGLNQIAQNSGQNCNTPQQANPQQMNYQQQSNIQQAPRQDFTQQASNLQPQLNSQQAATQQPTNSITNSQIQQQQNQNVASNVFSALHNIRQPSPNQGSNIAISNPQQTNTYGSKQNIDQKSLQPQPQNQPSPTFTGSTPTINKPQTVNQPTSVSMSYPEYSQYLPNTAFQSVPSNNIPSQQNQQMFAPSAQTSNTNSQNQGYLVQNLPVSNPMINQQSAAVQTPIVMVPSGQTYSHQNQPLVLTLQSPQMSLPQNLPNQPTGQISQPIIYTVQTQASSTPNQKQQIGSIQPQPNKDPMDNQSLLYYIMSQMQNPQGNNPLASILPAILNTKSEKSSSMKALLPLIINMLEEKKSGCACPHCGCNNNNNQNAQEPIANSEYSNHKNYSQKEPIQEFLLKITDNVDKSIKNTNGISDTNKNTNDENTSAGISEEEDDDEDSEEDYDDE